MARITGRIHINPERPQASKRLIELAEERGLNYQIVLPAEVQGIADRIMSMFDDAERYIERLIFEAQEVVR